MGASQPPGAPMIGSIWTVRALWCVAVAGIVVASDPLGVPARTPSRRALPVVPGGATDRPTADSLALAAEEVAEGNLFRAERGSVAPVAAPVVNAMPVQPRPALLLRGLVGGPAWQAIIEGIPGTDGAVVMRPGETREGITLRVVRRDTAILVTKDTTWKLTVQRAW